MSAQYVYVPPIRMPPELRFNEKHDEKGKFDEGFGNEGPTVGGALSTGVDFAHLSQRGKLAVAKNLKKWGVTQKKLEKEIESKLTPSNLSDGKEWYPEANQLADELAAKYNVSTEQAAGVIAALSPRTPWPRNEYLADRVLGMYDEYPDEMDSLSVANEIGGTLRANMIPAINMARGASVDMQLTGVKRRSFYNNILSPEGTNSVTVDTWMQRSVINASSRHMDLDDSLKFLNSAKTSTGGSGAGYLSISDAVRAVAARHNLPPSQIQAAYWIAVAGSKDGLMDGVPNAKS